MKKEGKNIIFISTSLNKSSFESFRTLLAYFLSKEVNEVSELLEKEREGKEKPKHGRGRSAHKEE